MKYKDNGVFKELLPVAKEGIKYEGTYEVAPTGWSIVSSEEDCTNNSILYFITSAKSSSEEIVYQPAHISVENKEQNVYEIRTTSENYRLANGIVCECEVI